MGTTQVKPLFLGRNTPSTGHPHTSFTHTLTELRFSNQLYVHVGSLWKESGLPGGKQTNKKNMYRQRENIQNFQFKPLNLYLWDINLLHPSILFWYKYPAWEILGNMYCITFKASVWECDRIGGKVHEFIWTRQPSETICNTHIPWVFCFNRMFIGNIFHST